MKIEVIRGFKVDAGKAIHLRMVCNQKGTALILALVMLAIMSLLGALALTTTESELGITANHRASHEAFLAADRAVEFATSNGAVFSAAGETSLDLDAYDAQIREGIGHLDTTRENKIEFLTKGDLPPGCESDPTYFEGRYYRISVHGTVDNHPAISRVETQFVRIFPKAGM